MPKLKDAATRTHCKHGHPLVPENLVPNVFDPEGKPRRQCKACRLADSRRWRRRHQATSEKDAKAVYRALDRAARNPYPLRPVFRRKTRANVVGRVLIRAVLHRS